MLTGFTQAPPIKELTRLLETALKRLECRTCEGHRTIHLAEHLIDCPSCMGSGQEANQ